MQVVDAQAGSSSDDEVRVRKVPTLRGWIIAGIVAAFAVSFQQITQPDYNTHVSAPPSQWLWFVLPGGALLAYGGWRVWRSRVETSRAGLAIVRVTETERVPWARVAGFEVRPTPNRGGTVIVARLVDQRVLRVGTVPGRKPKHRARAEAFAEQLRADQRELSA